MIPGLTDAVAGAAKGIVGSLMNGFDDLFTSKEEKLEKQAKLEKIASDLEVKVAEHLIEHKKLALEEAKAYLADTADARNANARIQESANASWLSKNVAYCIDIFLAALWGTVTIILFLKIFKITDVNVDMVSLMALHGTVTAVFMTVVNFHRGTSRSSEDKQKHIVSMQSK